MNTPVSPEMYGTSNVLPWLDRWNVAKLQRLSENLKHCHNVTEEFVQTRQHEPLFQDLYGGRAEGGYVFLNAVRRFREPNMSVIYNQKRPSGRELQIVSPETKRRPQQVLLATETGNVQLSEPLKEDTLRVRVVTPEDIIKSLSRGRRTVGDSNGVLWQPTTPDILSRTQASVDLASMLRLGNALVSFTEGFSIR